MKIKGNRYGNTFVMDFYPSRGIDALDMECISLEDAGLIQRENDTVPGMQRAYYDDEDEGGFYA